MFLSVVQPCYSEQLRIAVASNFEPTLNQLAKAFESSHEHKILISSGSSGHLFSQIKQGAPYDVFMSADLLRPQILVDEGFASDLSVYANGQLVFVGNHNQCARDISENEINHLAIANPELAPYGLAAKQYLEAENVWTDFQDKLVIGNNTAQATHMVISGNASAGIVAKSLIVRHKMKSDQCQFLIPNTSHDPINQAMVLLNKSKNANSFTLFKQFLNTDIAQQIIIDAGYLLGDKQ